MTNARRAQRFLVRPMTLLAPTGTGIPLRLPGPRVTSRPVLVREPADLADPLCVLRRHAEEPRLPECHPHVHPARSRSY
jgi:hypothetical protein